MTKNQRNRISGVYASAVKSTGPVESLSHEQPQLDPAVRNCQLFSASAPLLALLTDCSERVTLWVCSVRIVDSLFVALGKRFNLVLLTCDSRRTMAQFEEEPQLGSPGSIDPEMIQWYEALAK